MVAAHAIRPGRRSGRLTARVRWLAGGAVVTVAAVAMMLGDASTAGARPTSLGYNECANTPGCAVQINFRGGDIQLTYRASGAVGQLADVEFTGPNFPTDPNRPPNTTRRVTFVPADGLYRTQTLRKIELGNYFLEIKAVDGRNLSTSSVSIEQLAGGRPG